GEALDQAHATALPYMANTHVYAGDYSDCTDADIIVCAAGPSIVKSKDDAMPDRALLAVNNSKVTREVMEGITTYTKDAIIIYIIENELDYQKRQLIGKRTMIASDILSNVIAKNYKIDTKSVTVYMMGEQSITAVPVLSRLNNQSLGEKEIDHVLKSKIPLDR